MSDSRLGEIVLVASCTRRRLLATASAATAVLGLVLLSAATPATLGAAAACALCAAWAFFQARRPESQRRLHLGPDVRLHAQSASRMRIVFFAAQRRWVIWHDATDPATFRRLAVLARWQARVRSR